MSIAEELENMPLSYFVFYNERIDKGEFIGLDILKYNIPIIKKWIEIRKDYRFTEDTSNGYWRYIQIKMCRSKNSVNYIYIDTARKLWRIKVTDKEFYGDPGTEYNFD